MQEEKKATTPKKQSAAKRRRKRSTRSAAPAARGKAAAAPETASAAEPAAEQKETPAAPAPETAAPSAPETPETTETAAQTPEPAEAETPAQAAPAERAAEPDEAKPADEAEATASDAKPAETPAAEPEAPAEPAEEQPGEDTTGEDTADENSAGEENQPAEETPQEEAPAAEESAAEPSKPETEAKPDDAKPADEAEATASDAEPADPPAAEPEAPAEPAEEQSGEDMADENSAGEENQPAEETPQEDAPAAEGSAAEPSEPEAEAKPDDAKPADEAEATASDAEAAEPEAAAEADEQRVSDITRTVQLSIEQIMAHLDEAPAETETEPAPAAQEPAAEPAPTLGDHLRGGLTGIARWLLLVLVFVLVIAISGVVWLYRSATPDMLPQIRVTFAGQEISPASYRWKVPVVGKTIRRTYAETLSSAPATLAQPVDQTSPDFTVSPGGYRSELTVTDSEDAVVYEGDVETFANFQFTDNGDYTAELTVYGDESPVEGDASVTGSQTWQVAFTVEVRPTVHLFASSVQQGGVAAVTVDDTVDGRPPQINTTLKNAGFGKAGNGWVCYLPIPWNQAPGKQSLTVTVDGHSETLDFEVEPAKWDYKDYSSNYSLTAPYVGETGLPAELNTVLGKSETQVAWVNSNFVQPLLNTLDVKLLYGTTEYVGRSYNQRGSNPGTGGRTATNMVLSTTWGEQLIAPANGTVVLAKDLGEGFGNTLVIDHGAGVKSIFYHLQQLNVKVGDQLKQGQNMASCGSSLVAEMRIGTVPIDPRPVWRAQCDALKHY